MHDLVLVNEGKSANEIFGSPADFKFSSCLTLFDVVVPGEALFSRALAKFYGGIRDERSLEVLGAGAA